MLKRAIAGPLWFLATLTAYSVVAWMLGAPREVGPIISLVVAALVVLDPGGLIWPAQTATPARAAIRPAASPAIRHDVHHAPASAPAPARLLGGTVTRAD